MKHWHTLRRVALGPVVGSLLVGFLAASLTVASPALAGHSGDLDSSFAGDGLLSTPISDDLGARGTELAVQPDGKIVVVASVTVSSHVDPNANRLVEQSAIALLRYLPDGSPDPSFGGGDGQTVTDLPGDDESATALALAPDGGILVSVATTTTAEFVVLRYTGEGSLDATFGEDGIATVSFDASYVRTLALALQPDGRIIVAGGANDPATGQGWPTFALTRLTAGGSPDASFGSGGTVRTLIDQGGEVTALTIDGLGRIVAAGAAFNFNYTQGAVARYLPDGSLDSSFSTDGWVLGVERDIAGVAIDDSNRVLLGGASDGGQYHAAADAVVRRFTADGDFDTTFGDGASYVRYDLATSLDRVLGFQRRPDGGLLLAGGTGPHGPGQPFVMVLTAEGAKDTTFSNDGVATFQADPDGLNQGEAVHQLADGRIVVSGSSESGELRAGMRQIFVARLLVDDPTLSLAGARTTETDTGTATMEFTMSLSRAADRPVEVSYRTNARPEFWMHAEPGVDYIATSGTLILAPGTTSGRVSVTILPDDVYEGSELVELEVTDVASMNKTSANGTIDDDDPVPSISVLDASVVEGDAGTRDLDLTITLTGAVRNAFAVGWETQAGSALGGEDYLEQQGYLVIPALATSATVKVPIVGDARSEANESFLVVLLGGGCCATIGDSTATATIVDDDLPPSVSAWGPTGAGADPTTSIWATFDREVDPSSVSVTVRDDRNRPVAGTVSYDGTTRTASFHPDRRLRGRANYTATASAANAAGAGPAKSWTFTTRK